MKVTVNHAKISQAFLYTSKAVSAKPNIPVLSNVLVEATKLGLNLSATNLDMGINLWIPAKVDEEGKTTVSARFISDFVSASNGEKVDLELKNTVLDVKTEKSKANFNTIPAQEFPILPKVVGEPLFKISVREFVDSMDKVIFACSTDMSASKIQQTGVLFELGTDEINFVGLDSFRLSLRRAKASNIKKDEGKSEIIVPAKYLAEISKIVHDQSDVDSIDVYLSETKSQIIFKFGDVEFSIRLLEGPYPDYKRIMPDSSSYNFEVSKDSLEKAVKVINTFARSNLGYKTLFDFDIENLTLKLKASVAEVGENETEIQVENADGVSDLNSAYNLKYLHDLVNHISGDKIRFETKGALAASVFKDSGDTKFLHLVMPLRREV